VADGGGLENRYGVTPIVGSNPTPSARGAVGVLSHPWRHVRWSDRLVHRFRRMSPDVLPDGHPERMDIERSSRAPNGRAHWLVPALLALAGYAVFAAGASISPKGLDARPVNVPAVAIAYAGLGAMLIGLVILVRRVVRELRHRGPRPGDRAMVRSWDAAVASAELRTSHLVYISSVQRFGRTGCKAWCVPYLGGSIPGHSSWFEGTAARWVRARRWMQLDGDIGGGIWGDRDVLYVRSIVNSFPRRVPYRAQTLRRRDLEGVKAIS
jgi:hypothetical protein